MAGGGDLRARRDEPESLKVHRVGESGRVPGIAVTAVVAVLALLVIKPWAGESGSNVVPLPSASSTAAGGTSAASPQATLAEPSVDPEIQAAIDRSQCQGHTSWAIVTMERTESIRTRTLIPVVLTRTSDPRDPTIATHIVYAAELRGLGFCVPGKVPAVVAEERASVRLWGIGEFGGASVIGTLDVIDKGLAQLGEVYYASDGPFGTTLPWAPGQYAFEIRGTRLSGPSDWFGFEFKQIGG